MKCKLPSLLECLALLLIVLAEPSESARSSYRSSYRGSYRSYSGSSSRNRYGSSRGSGYNTLSMLVASRFSYRTSFVAYRRGIIFAPWAWRQSHADYPTHSTLCFNVRDSIPAHYSSSVVEPWLYQNLTVYGLFVCPMEAGRTDRTYCCGDEDREVCCSFWEDPGRVAGLIVGLLVSIGCCIFGVFKLYRVFMVRRCGSRQVESTVVVTQTTTAAAAAAGVDVTGPQACGYPAEPQHPDTAGGAEPDFNKQQEPQPPGYYNYGQMEPPPPGNPAMEQPPYPVFAPPPAYWDATNGGGNHHQLEPLPPPVRH